MILLCSAFQMAQPELSEPVPERRTLRSRITSMNDLGLIQVGLTWAQPIMGSTDHKMGLTRLSLLRPSLVLA